MNLFDVLPEEKQTIKTESRADQEKAQTVEAKKMVLGSLWELCYRAHSGTSFSPERRANSYVKDYSEELKADLLTLGENSGNYKEKYINHFSNWMSAKSRCISSMITGGSNFPVRRAQKANNSESNRYNEFINWRERYFNAVNRVPTKSPEDDREAAEKKLERLLNVQLEMKAINAEIRKCKITDFTELVNHLTIKEEFNPVLVSCMDSYHARQTGKYKIPGFTLTNNNAKIKAAAQKIKTMETRIDTKNTWKDIIFEGGHVTIEDDRLKIFHDEKPERAIIQEIKSNGFRWSPNWACWCRKHTGNAIYSLKFLSFINTKK